MAKRDEVTGEWRTLHSEGIYDLCCPPNIIRVIKSRRIRLARHVARMAEKKDAYRVLVGKLERKRRIGRPRPTCGDTILKWIFRKWDGGMDWIDLV